MNKQTRPYGTWPSPISAALLGYKKRLDDVQFSPDGKTLVWSEGRSGQTVLVMRRGADAPRDLFPDLSVRPGVGYGGGGFAIHNDFVIFVSNGRLYRQQLDSGRPYPITPAFGGLASPAISPDGQWVAFVHTYERRDVLAIVPADGSAWPVKAAEGADFYMQPVWHPDGWLAWVEWDFPNMPWDGTRLKQARWHDGRLQDAETLAGDADTPIFQPAYSPDGRYLTYIAQDSERDTLYCRDLSAQTTRALVNGGILMTPAWVQGLRTYAWESRESLVYLQNEAGFARLQRISLDGKNETLDTAPYTWLAQPAASPLSGAIALVASSSRIPDRIITRTVQSSWQIQARSESESVPQEALPAVQPIQWQAEDGTAVHALYYPPTSASFTDEGLPPAIVSIHGGPTSQRVANYNPYAAYFATRGYAWLEVNYRGSTGYGRSYMTALYGRWGEVDTQDAVGAAKALAAQNLADPQRIAIMGGSAGGYTVLNALIQFPGVFKAGVDMYGVSNLFSLNLDTHKFEQHYNDKLVGQLPEAAEKFRAWSPVFHADKIRDAVAVFQGSEDPVVVPDQSESIVAALRANHVPHIYHVYEGEGHGWRKSETIIDFYPRVERFLLQYLLFA